MTEQTIENRAIPERSPQWIRIIRVRLVGRIVLPAILLRLEAL